MPLLLLAAGLSAAADCPSTTAALPLPAWAGPADPRLGRDALVVVLKEARRIGVYSGGALEPGACWPVALAWRRPGEDVDGPKRRRGDRRTPEGWYRTADKPESRYYHALWVSYPNAADAERGLADGLISRAVHDRIVEADRAGRLSPQDTALGGQILIHGGGARVDWTLGCVAMADADIDALRARLPDGQRTDVLLLP